MKFLTDEQLAELLPAETSSFASPVPTQIVSSDEYMPVPQTEKQRAVEARLKELGDGLATPPGPPTAAEFPDRSRDGDVVCRDQRGLWQ